MTGIRERREGKEEGGELEERCKNPSCKRIEKEKQRLERGSSDRKAKKAWSLKQMLLYLAVFSLMEEPFPSAASMGFCSSREEIDAGGRDAKWMKTKRERKKVKTNLCWAATFWCNVITRVRLTVECKCSIYRSFILWLVSSIHRFLLSNRNRTELARFYSFKNQFSILVWFS